MRVLALRAAGVAMSASILAASLLASTYTVTTAADAGAGSLRQAILDANVAADADTIQFNIPGAGVHTITPLTDFPMITGPVTIDGYTHVSRFVDMHDLGDMLVHAGFADPVIDMEMITVTYPGPDALLAELKAIGATNQTRGRPRGLTGRRRRQALHEALAGLARDGRVPATFEVVYGHAWKAEPRRTPEGLPIVTMQKRR